MEEPVPEPFPATLPPPPPPPIFPSAVPAPPPPPPPKSDFFYKPWDKFTRKKKNAPSAELTPSIDRDEEGLPTHHPQQNEEGVVTHQRATTSYEEAAAACKAKVDAIVAECKRLNVKYYDMVWDLANNRYDCLVSLDPSEIPDSVEGLSAVASVKRVEDIFEKPQFFVEGIDANDIMQGYIGDCWFLAAVSAMSGMPKLIEKICVARDEKVGVYGFVFYRDGEWVSEVVDDRLCIKRSDDNTKYPTEYMINVSGQEPMWNLDLSNQSNYYVSKLPKEFSEPLRKGSKSLYFSSCKDSNETWLPLLEKAYAKAHGDYQAIEGGIIGEGIEDLTGGVAVSLPSEDILDKDKLWRELTQVNKDFLFGCSSRRGRSWEVEDDEGFVRGHAYTVLEARELRYKGDDVRLLKIRNPWGEQEWNGAWSDGSKEWTADAMKELNHTFGNDGVFWIAFKDFLKYYPYVHRTRLFGPEWSINQQWTSVEVPWTSDYLDSKFTITIKKKSHVVLVLSQPDDRYFQGLTGRYGFNLHFRLYKDGEKTYLLRSMEDSGSGRSCTAELDMEPGSYHLLIKVNSGRYDGAKTPEEVIKENRENRREKLLAIGKSFDLGHSKGNLREAEKRVVDREKKTAKTKARSQKVAGRDLRKKERERERKRKARIDAEKERKKAAKLAEKIKNKPPPPPAAEPAAEAKAVEQPVEVEKKQDPAADKPVEVEKKQEPAADKPVEVEKKPATTEPEKKAKTEEKTEPKPDPEVVIPGNEPVTEEVKEVQKPTPSQATTSAPPRDSTAPPSGSSRSSASAVVHPTPPSTPGAATAASTAETAKDDKAGTAPGTPSVAVPASVPTDSSAPVEQATEEKEPMDKHEMATELRQIATQLETETADDVSDVSEPADDDFDWDSDIDGSLSSESEEDDEDDDMYKEDPWKAVCVMGLRAYHLDAGLEIGFIGKKN